MNHLQPKNSGHYLFFLVFYLIYVEVVVADEPATAAQLESQIKQAENVAWTRFYSQKTNLFYDYISSYEPGQELGHLPTVDEVKRQYPNPCGYSTGMEDCMILGGAMLSTLVDKYSVTNDEQVRSEIAQVFAGVKLCATVHGVPGFIARGVCPADGKSIYINSSRDQYTHCVHGLWRYYHSPLSDPAAKNEIRKILVAISERMVRNVTPENNHCSLRADGKQCPLGISRMWKVKPHEAARLPMIFAATWDVTQNQKYYDLYREYLLPAIEQTESMSPQERHATYVFLQMQCSFEVLYNIEKNSEVKKRLSKIMQQVVKQTESQAHYSRHSLEKVDLTKLGPDWRKAEKWINQSGYSNPQWGHYRHVWHVIREVGESAVVSLMLENETVSAKQKQNLENIILKMDYNQTSSCGIIYHLAAYWKARRQNVFE